MDDRKIGLGEPEDGADGPNREDGNGSQATSAQSLRARADRARVLEQATYSLTDLFTIISGRIEILSEKVPAACREELLAIREELKKGMELNRRFFLVAQACQRETASENNLS